MLNYSDYDLIGEDRRPLTAAELKKEQSDKGKNYLELLHSQTDLLFKPLMDSANKLVKELG